MSRSSASRSSSSPAGMPSTIATSPGPCDSPAVVKRKPSRPRLYGGATPFLSRTLRRLLVRRRRTVGSNLTFRCTLVLPVLLSRTLVIAQGLIGSVTIAPAPGAGRADQLHAAAGERQRSPVRGLRPGSCPPCAVHEHLEDPEDRLCGSGGGRRRGRRRRAGGDRRRTRRRPCRGRGRRRSSRAWRALCRRGRAPRVWASASAAVDRRRARRLVEVAVAGVDEVRAARSCCRPCPARVTVAYGQFLARSVAKSEWTMFELALPGCRRRPVRRRRRSCRSSGRSRWWRRR